MRDDPDQFRDGDYVPHLPAVIRADLSIPPETTVWRNGLLIRAPNWLGDCVMCLPAVRRLRDVVPAACGLFVMCREKLAEFWLAVPQIDAVSACENRRASRDDIGRTRRLGAGVAVVFPNSFGAALDVRRLGTPVRLGRAGNGRSFLLTHRLPPWRRSRWRDGHQAAVHAELAAVFGEFSLADYTRGPLLRVSPEDTARTLERFDIGSDAGPILAIAPGAAYGPAKQWPPEYFAEVARRWREQGGQAVIAGAPSEQELGQRVAELSGATNLAGRTSLGDLIRLLAGCTAAVTNDSGAMHLAAAVGCNGVAVFGSTDPHATGPVGARWIVVQEPADCSPCFRRTCNRPEADYRCLRRIAPERVMRALRNLLQSA